jgi:hypothetical protein
MTIRSLRLLSTVVSGISTLLIPIILPYRIGLQYFNLYDFISTSTMSVSNLADSGSSNSILTSRPNRNHFLIWISIVYGLTVVCTFLFIGSNISFTLSSLLLIIALSAKPLQQYFQKYGDAIHNTAIDKTLIVIKILGIFLLILTLLSTAKTGINAILLKEILFLSPFLLLLINKRTFIGDKNISLKTFARNLFSYSKPLYLVNLLSLLIIFWERSLLIQDEAAYSKFAISYRFILMLLIFSNVFSQYIIRDYSINKSIAMRTARNSLNLTFLFLSLFICIVPLVTSFYKIDILPSISVLLLYTPLQAISVILTSQILSEERTKLYSEFSIVSVVVGFIFVFLVMSRSALFTFELALEFKFLLTQAAVLIYVLFRAKKIKNLVSIFQNSMIIVLFFLFVINFCALIFLENLYIAPVLTFLYLTLNLNNVTNEIKSSFSENN